MDSVSHRKADIKAVGFDLDAVAHFRYAAQ